MKDLAAFSGSYAEEDVRFLLKPISMPFVEVEAKERLIQSKKRHYSEMISREQKPTQSYLSLFHGAVDRDGPRLARDLLRLAERIGSDVRGEEEVVVVSLARAGTPVGVLLTRFLRCFFRRKVVHYSISIIRDRGVDGNALSWILQRHGADRVVFVDGWTGKGVIARELRSSVDVFNRTHHTRLPTGLYVVSDLCGAAFYGASEEDYLIPNAILNGTVSGLVSRSILNDQYIGPDDFHGCLYLAEFEQDDLSVWYVDTLETMASEVVSRGSSLSTSGDEKGAERDWAGISRSFLAEAAARWGVTDENHLKPGIGEATRVMLRRVPELLVLRDPEAVDVAHLVCLAREKGVDVEVVPGLPYQAAAIIKKVLS